MANPQQNQADSPTVDVVGVGNAIVDVIGTVDESFITEWELNKGSMTLIDEPRAEQLTGLMPDSLKESGGSAANTMVGVASFGVSAAYIGKVRDDELGAAFADGMREAGVAYDVVPADAGMATARCLIQVTPDGQRTMNTFLGASSRLTVADIDESLVAGASALYCEGYLWDLEEAKAAIRHAMDVARSNGVSASFTLSDPFAVDRHQPHVGATSLRQGGRRLAVRAQIHELFFEFGVEHEGVGR